MKKLNRYVSTALLAAAATITLVSTVGCASSEDKVSTGQYIDDSVVTTKVKAALVKNDMTKATEINVETRLGVVQLSGFVTSQANADAAVLAARNVAGVKDVVNDIRIK